MNVNSLSGSIAHGGSPFPTRPEAPDDPIVATAIEIMEGIKLAPVPTLEDRIRVDLLRHAIESATRHKQDVTRRENDLELARNDYASALKHVSATLAVVDPE